MFLAIITNTGTPPVKAAEIFRAAPATIQRQPIDHHAAPACAVPAHQPRPLSLTHS